MQTLLSYNFYTNDIADKDFRTLFEKTRRDSAFAFVFQDETGIYAIRDHLGTCPLWYMKKAGQWLFSTNLADLPHSVVINELGLKSYIGLHTTKIKSPFEGVEMVAAGTVLHFPPDGEPRSVYQYHIKPEKSSLFGSYSSAVDTLDQLFKTALLRQLRAKTEAGLYLSGGIDSGLIGLYLKEIGVRTFTYSASKKTENNLERDYTDINVSLIEPAHHSVGVVERSYESLTESAITLYKQPPGNATALSVTNLWDQTNIGQSPIIFFGQNSDVINNAMDNNQLTTFGFPFSHIFGLSKRRLDKMFANYVTKQTYGILTNDPLDLGRLYGGQKLSSLHLVALAGMYLRRTPSDGELLAQPAINKDIPIGNPFYDMDLVEFLMGLHPRHKIGWKKGVRVPISFDKRVLQTLALKKGIPAKLVFRKKGFNISGSTDFFRDLPDEISGIQCHDHHQRFAAHTMKRYRASKTQ